MEFFVHIGLLFLGAHMIFAKDGPDASSCARWHEPDGMDAGVRTRSIPQHAQLQKLSTIKSCRWPTPCLPATLTVAELLPNKVRRASIQGTRRHMAVATKWCKTLN
jgi:hypothetical protein